MMQTRCRVFLLDLGLGNPESTMMDGGREAFHRVEQSRI